MGDVRAWCCIIVLCLWIWEGTSFFLYCSREAPGVFCFYSAAAADDDDVDVVVDDDDDDDDHVVVVVDDDDDDDDVLFIGTHEPNGLSLISFADFCWQKKISYAVFCLKKKKIFIFICNLSSSSPIRTPICLAWS